MDILIQLYPNLRSEIQTNHSVTIGGYEPGSSIITFTNGSSSAVKIARQVFQEKLQQVVIEDVPLACVELVSSAKKRLEMEGIQVLVTEVGTSLQLCSLGRKELERALMIVRGKPFEDLVQLSSTSVEAISGDINNLQDGYAVHISVNSGAVIIRGFVEEDVITASKCVQKLIANASIMREPLNCSPEQHAYLCKALIKEPTEQGKSLVSSIPAEVSFIRGKISLVGSPEAVQQSREVILRSELFCRLKLQNKFPFTCSVAFISQIVQHIFKQYEDKLDFAYYIPDAQLKQAGKKGAPITKEKNKGFSITVFSGTPDHFSKICTELEVWWNTS